jgi:hypothetical protein
MKKALIVASLLSSIALAPYAYAEDINEVF